MVITIRVDPFAFDVLHHEVRPSILRHPRIQDPNDIRVLTQRDLDGTFRLEPPNDQAAVEALVDQFDSQLLLCETLKTYGAVHTSNTSTSNQSGEAISVDFAAHHRISRHDVD